MVQVQDDLDIGKYSYINVNVINTQIYIGVPLAIIKSSSFTYDPKSSGLKFTTT